jgi:fido (protein-threonine AMPylation protein)
MNHAPPYKWSPIEDLPANWQAMASPDMPSLVRVWEEQAARLRESSVFQVFIERMRREIAIETGVIERLYTIDRGITQLLIEEGIDESLIPHGTTDKPVSEVVAMIRDHERAVAQLFVFVTQESPLSTSFIKQLHQLLTEHQPFVDAVDQFGNVGKVKHERGTYKRFANNPRRPDGEIHEYAPPEQVDSEMDQLIRWHLQHVQMGTPPEIEAAWLHHRFTQIHPFQDGNGRVARCLATLIFIRAKWFPLVVTRDDRVPYIESLEKADHGDLQPLVNLCAKAQRRAFVRSLSLSEQVLAEQRPISGILASVKDELKGRQAAKIEEARAGVEHLARRLFGAAQQRLNAVTNEIRSELGNLAPVNLALAENTEPERRTYYRHQIIETAKQLDYYANYRDYHSWLLLRLGETASSDSHAEILISFHGLGREYFGLLACTICVYWKDPSDDGSGKIIRDIKPMVEAPFQFTYADDAANLEVRFMRWLEDALVAGLEFWRKGL